MAGMNQEIDFNTAEKVVKSMVQYAVIKEEEEMGKLLRRYDNEEDLEEQNLEEDQQLLQLWVTLTMVRHHYLIVLENLKLLKQKQAELLSI